MSDKFLEKPKAYNPKAVEPTITGKFHSGSPEIRELREEQRARGLQMFDRGAPEGRKSPSYKEAWDVVMRGEGHTMGHYVSEMTFDIYPGMEDELMDGAWDTHGHIFPDYVPRKIDIISYAVAASEARMGGIVCKDHFTSTMGQAWATQWIVDEMVRRGDLDYA